MASATQGGTSTGTCCATARAMPNPHGSGPGGMKPEGSAHTYWMAWTV